MERPAVRPTAAKTREFPSLSWEEKPSSGVQQACYAGVTPHWHVTHVHIHAFRFYSRLPFFSFLVFLLFFSFRTFTLAFLLQPLSTGDSRAGPQQTRNATAFDPQVLRQVQRASGVPKTKFRTRRRTSPRPFVINVSPSGPIAAPRFESDCREEPYKTTVRVSGQEITSQRTREVQAQPEACVQEA